MLQHHINNTSSTIASQKYTFQKWNCALLRTKTKKKIILGMGNIGNDARVFPLMFLQWSLNENRKTQGSMRERELKKKHQQYAQTSGR